ncbi:MAG: NTP transferase domain-containing protein [Planctomycetota bacterium]
MTLAAVVLAAGASSRLGAPKALASIGARTVLERLLVAAASADGAPLPLVVTGAHHDEIAALVRGRSLAADLVRNDLWERGRTGSVARAVAARKGLDLVVLPADVPLVERETVEALAAAWRDAGEPAGGWLAPWVDGETGGGRRYGHPVILGRELARRAEGLGPGAPLRELRSRAAPLLGVRVADVAILDDLDTPDDLERLRVRARGD